MPIEIRELIIRTHITEGEPGKKRPSVNHDHLLEKTIVECCVDKVMRLLNKKKQR